MDPRHNFIVQIISVLPWGFDWVIEAQRSVAVEVDLRAQNDVGLQNENPWFFSGFVFDLDSVGCAVRRWSDFTHTCQSSLGVCTAELRKMSRHQCLLKREFSIALDSLPPVFKNGRHKSCEAG